MANPLFHNIPPALKAAYFFLMTFFTGAFLVFIGMLIISWMGGTGLDAIEQVMREPENESFLSIMRILTTLNQIGAFLVASFFFLRVFGKDSVEALYFKPIAPKWWILVPIIMLAATPLIDITMRFNTWIIPEGSWLESIFKPMEDSAAELTAALLSMDSPMTLVLNLIIIAIIPALGEELAFRGILQNQLAKTTRNIHLAVWITGIIFSAYHFQFYGFIPRMLLGVFFGYLVVWTGSIWPSIIAHCTNNAAAVIAIYYGQKSPGYNEDLMTSETPPSLIYIALGLVIFALGIYLLWRDSKWKSIRDRYLHWEKVEINPP